MINLTEIQERLVLNTRQFGAPNARGPCHMARMAPLWKGLIARIVISRDHMVRFIINLTHI